MQLHTRNGEIAVVLASTSLRRTPSPIRVNLLSGSLRGVIWSRSISIVRGKLLVSTINMRQVRTHTGLICRGSRDKHSRMVERKGELGVVRRHGGRGQCRRRWHRRRRLSVTRARVSATRWWHSRSRWLVGAHSGSGAVRCGGK